MLFVNSGMAAAVGTGGSDDPYKGADIVLDFVGVKNAGAPFYRRAGVVYASATAADFDVSGTINASGFLAVGAQSALRAMGTLSDFVVYAEYFNGGALESFMRLWTLAGGTQEWAVLRQPSSSYNTFPATTTTAASSRVAFGRSGGFAKVSFDGATVATGAVSTAPGNTTFIIGNNGTLGQPFGNYIRLIELHLGTLSDAQIQGLAA